MVLRIAENNPELDLLNQEPPVSPAQRKLPIQSGQRYFHGYNLGMYSSQLQSLYDEYHNEKLVGLTEKAQLNNNHLSLLTEILSCLYTELKNHPDEPIDLTELQPSINLLREVYNEMAKENAEEFSYYDSNCPFPENIADLKPDAIREITQKLESLRTRKQGQLPQLMTMMQETGQLLLAIVEITKDLTKSLIDGIKHVTNNTAKG